MPRDEQISRYRAPLFYLSPHYPALFPGLDRLVSLDTGGTHLVLLYTARHTAVLDIQLQSDLAILIQQFDRFQPGEASCINSDGRNTCL